MAKVVDREDLFLLWVGLDMDAHRRVFASWQRVKHSLKHPFLMCCEYVLVAAANRAVELKSSSPMEIVYDDNAKYRPLFAEAYKDYLHEAADDPAWAAVMPHQPWFRDDKEFVMLQAADMLAGYFRLAGTDDKPMPLQEGICAKLRDNGRAKLIDEDEMRRLDAFLRERGSRGEL
jgi:hypothetical protein